MYVCLKKMVCHVFNSHFFSFCFSFATPNYLLSQCPRGLQWTVTLFPGKNFPLSPPPSRASKWVHTHIMSPQCQELEGTTLHKQTAITAHYAQQQLSTHARAHKEGASTPCSNLYCSLLPSVSENSNPIRRPHSDHNFHASLSG